MTRTIQVSRYGSPIGEMLIGAYGEKICLCDWLRNKRRDTIDRRICRYLEAGYEDGSSEVIRQTVAQLDEYFEGDVGLSLFRSSLPDPISNAGYGRN